MRARVLLVGVAATSAMVIVGPTWAKGSTAEARITGPGLGDGIRIEAPHPEGLWASGIDVAGGLDDTRAGYVVSYRFDSSNSLIRQDLYPYAQGGPVARTPPGQELNMGIDLPIVASWYQGPLDFFRYLVDSGLPDTDPSPRPPHPRPCVRSCTWG